MPADQTKLDDRPVMSVAVPCYNYGNYLPQCIDSIRSQEGVSVRILIIDDASPDGSIEVCRDLAERYPEVELLEHPTNRGHIVTFTECAEWANGLGFVLISADDMLAAGALRRAADVLVERPSVGMVYGDVLTFTERPPEAISGSTVLRTSSGLDWVRRRCATTVNNIYSPEVVLRTDVQHRVGGYHSELSYTSDLHMWLRVAAVSDVAYIKGATHAFYRRHASNMSVDLRGSMLDLEQRRKTFSVFFSEDWLPSNSRDELRRETSRVLARDAMERASRILDERGTNADSEALANFALETDPSITRRPAGLGYALRNRVGPGRFTWLPPFIAGRGVRWLRYKRRTPGWHRGPD